jgi:cellulose synthase/poly-beta-1,6-N-acetylglucosamine synthase-like glycosyltransferase
MAMRSTVTPNEMDALERSVGWLRDNNPEMSAYETVTSRQRWILFACGVGLVAGLLLNALVTIVAVNLLVTAVYVAALIYKFQLVRVALSRPALVTVNDEEALSLSTADLPTYTVLVAAYREAGVIARTIKAIDALDYPRHRLEVLLLFEEDDAATIAAAEAARPPAYMRIITVPRAHPLTKPKACNYGLRFAHGDFVTIYDAEDRPEPLQLRRAVAAFRRLHWSVACLQAKLSYHNPQQNLITQLFTAEYLTWFSLLLPALAASGGPVPLGGTSMHVDRGALEAVGGWDPCNVTEDADLGIRLQRMGYRTAVLDSTTFEEANSDFVNWVKQRSRWYKGYIQTWLVHMRHPLQLRRQLGTQAFVAFNLTVGATPLIAVLNPIFWALTILWFGTKANFVQPIFPPSVYYAGLFCMVFGNFMVIYLNIIVIRATNRPELLGAVLLSPLYWLMMSVAAIKAFIQLLVAPSFWEKTTHGLDPITEDAGTEFVRVWSGLPAPNYGPGALHRSDPEVIPSGR